MRYALKIEPSVPFSFCDGCRFFDLRTEEIFIDDQKEIVGMCDNEDICVNAVRLSETLNKEARNED